MIGNLIIIFDVVFPVDLSEEQQNKLKDTIKLNKNIILYYIYLTITTVVKMTSQISVELNKTFNHTIDNYRFGNLPDEICKELWKDGRPFSHFIEGWIAENYPLTHVKGCKKYDFTDKNYPEILYDEKTFTKKGCAFCPSICWDK